MIKFADRETFDKFSFKDLNNLERSNNYWKKFPVLDKVIILPKFLEGSLVDQNRIKEALEYKGKLQLGSSNLEDLDLFEMYIIILKYISYVKYNYLKGLEIERVSVVEDILSGWLIETPRDPCLIYFQFCLLYSLKKYRLSILFLHNSTKDLRHQFLDSLLLYLSVFVRDHKLAKAILIANENSGLTKTSFSRYYEVIQKQVNLFTISKTENFFNDESVDSNLIPKILEINEFSDKVECAYFCFCDSVYFNVHGLSLIYSFIEVHDGKEGLHVHIVNPTEVDINRIQAVLAQLQGFLKFSYEVIDFNGLVAPNVYYSCMRYVRLNYFFNRACVSYGMIDADILIKKKSVLSDLFSNKISIAFKINEDEPIWDAVSAGFVLFKKDSKFASKYLEYVSNFILSSMSKKNYYWFLDQVALFSAAYNLPKESCMEICILDSSYLDLECRDSSLIWAVTNDKNKKEFIAYREHLQFKYEINN